jgi:guanosine-3',5'-bis(diphosphate) 3'-pyrophosphohydrolase
VPYGEKSEMEHHLVLQAAKFAGDKHRNQRRKDANLSPYINHLIDVAHLLCEAAAVEDPEILAAAFLHDALEDTDTVAYEIESIFGQRVLGIVLEVTDDKTLPKDVRKRLQVEHAAKLSSEAALIKIADKISNIRDIIYSPPSDWDLDRRKGYLDWAEKVIGNCPNVDDAFKKRFDSLLQKGRALLDQLEDG